MPAVKTTALHVRVMYLFPFLYTSLNYVDKLSSIILAKNCRKIISIDYVSHDSYATKSLYNKLSGE